MGYLIDILIAVATRIVTGELSAHAEPMARWIIGRAVERLPTDDRDRFREEWLAHLDETPGTLRKLWHAVGCHLGAGKVADALAKRPPHIDEATPTVPPTLAPPNPSTNVMATPQILSSVRLIFTVQPASRQQHSASDQSGK
jgi:hypothetical protein